MLLGGAEIGGSLHVDIAIVGAGTVGLFAAKILAGTGKRILIIDAGGLVPSTESNRQISVNIGDAHRGIRSGRAAGLGGTSALWGGQLSELEASDMQTWPIEHSELRAHYDECYRLLGLQSIESDAHYRRQFGNEEGSIDGVERFFTHWLPQPNFSTLFASTVNGTSNVNVVTRLTAYSLELCGAKIAAINCRSSVGHEVKVRASHFIFASGTVGAIRFFLSTAITQDVPWSKNATLGRFFHDHLASNVASVEVSNESRFRQYFENAFIAGMKVQPKLRHTKDVRAGQRSACSAFLSFESDLSEYLANLKSLARSFRSGFRFSSLKSFPSDLTNIGGYLLPVAMRYLKDRRMLAVFDKGISLRVQAEQIPISTANITLTGQELLEDGLHRVALHWRKDGREIRSIKKLTINVDSYLRSRELGSLTIDQRVLDEDVTYVQTMSDTYHQCGGLIMGTSDSNSVVDSNCRVWGLDNAWVAGAATMPSSGYANSTLTALALTSRICETLIRRCAG